MKGLKVDVVLPEKGLVVLDAAEKLLLWKSGLPGPRDQRAWNTLNIGPNAATAGEEPVFFPLACPL
jgi:hypothetical protein